MLKFAQSQDLCISFMVSHSLQSSRTLLRSHCWNISGQRDFQTASSQKTIWASWNVKSLIPSYKFFTRYWEFLNTYDLYSPEELEHWSQSLLLAKWEFSHQQVSVNWRGRAIRPLLCPEHGVAAGNIKCERRYHPVICWYHHLYLLPLDHPKCDYSLCSTVFAQASHTLHPLQSTKIWDQYSHNDLKYKILR